MSEFLEATTIDHWRRDPVRFIDEVLRDPETEKPFVLLDAEKSFISHAFQTNDDDRLLYRNKSMQRRKRAGRQASRRS
jgi:hypothetical protein